MGTVGTAYVQIVPSAQGIGGSISKILSPEASSAGSAAGVGIAGAMKKAIVAAGIGAAFVKVVKGAMGEGAALQQSYIGGLETLYGDAAEAARGYAREAAAAGISMNDYSEQAVSFGAALKNAYGGDVKKAAEAANTAILDMADNSAKMGTDITSVQMAYQGFAKQNYTMLDNLKLGYGGTKSEMERLLSDAEKLTGVHYNIDNLGDVYDAIHVIQGDLGLTGVAAEEASQTFSGSFNAMKASAQNALGSLALGENVGPSLQTLATSVSTFFFGNFIPMLGTIIKSIPGAALAFIQTGFPLLLNGISNMISSIATQVGNLANSLSGEKVAEWARTMIPKILSSAASLLGNFASGLLRNLPKIAIAIAKIGLAIVKGLGSALWGKVKAAATGIATRFMAPINALKAKVKAAIDKVKNLFPFKIGKVMSNIKLPHFSVSGKFGLNPPQAPKLSLKWFAKGGIMDGPTLFGLAGGEKGPEAILPLDSFWDRLDNMNSGGITINLNYNASDDANDMVRDIARNVKLYRMAGAL